MKYEYLNGSEKDFEGAPDEALFVLQCYSTTDYSEDMETTIDGQLLKPSDHQYIIAERRPITEPVWSGDGLPPVGSKVMTKSGEGVVDYVGSGVIVYSNNDGQWSVRCDSLDCSLSAIRLPEDVARDEAIKGIGILCKAAFSWQDAAKDIYKAIEHGRIPGITLSGK